MSCCALRAGAAGLGATSIARRATENDRAHKPLQAALGGRPLHRTRAGSAAPFARAKALNPSSSFAQHRLPHPQRSPQRRSTRCHSPSLARSDRCGTRSRTGSRDSGADPAANGNDRRCAERGRQPYRRQEDHGVLDRVHLDTKRALEDGNVGRRRSDDGVLASRPVGQRTDPQPQDEIEQRNDGGPGIRKHVSLRSKKGKPLVPRAARARVVAALTTRRAHRTSVRPGERCDRHCERSRGGD